MTQRALEMRTFSGPSISAPFAAVAADFAIPETAARTQIFAEALRHVLPETVLARLQALDWTTPFEALVAAAAQALLGWHGRNDFPCITNRTSSGRGQVFLGYQSEHATVLALTLGYDLVVAGWTRGAITVDPQSAPEARLTQFALTMERQPRELAQHLMRVARTRGIPFFPIGAGLGILQYGHGKYGRHFFGTSSHRDSGTGQMLQHNKVASNLLVKRLGFPGVEHGVADNIDNAQRLADQIGYPVVIKPIDSSQGRGVTPGITSGDEIPTAFAAADTLSPGRVIIERFVKGDTFRLAVFGGELASQLCALPHKSWAPVITPSRNLSRSKINGALSNKQTRPLSAS